MVLIPVSCTTSRTSVHSSSGTLSIRSNPLNLSLPLYSHKGFDLCLESPLDCKEIQPVHPKENQPGIFIGKTDAEAETPILWPPDVKS